MAITIIQGVNMGLLLRATDAYVGDVRGVLMDAEGNVLAGGDLPAPVFTTAPTGAPTAAVAGDTVTLTVGAASNATGLTGRLMLGGSDITSEVSNGAAGGTWTARAGSWSWQVTAQGPGGDTTATAITGTVTAAPAVFARTATAAATRSVHSGHSLTDAYVHSGAWPKDLRLITKSVLPTFNDDGDGAGGITKSTIPGSTLRHRWDNPTTPKDARIDAGEFDALVITEGGPPPRPHYAPHNDQMKESLEYLLWFVQNQYDNGTGQDVIVWSIWPYLDGNASRPEASHWTEFGGFRNALPEYGRSFKYMADYATWKMHQLYPALPADWRVWLFPGHLWMQRVYDDVQAGLVPGVTEFASLFNDDIHPSDVTGYGLACFMFSLMYQVDLRTVSGAYVPPGYPAGLAAYYQGIAWELATSYEPAGMGGTEGAALVFDPATDPDPLEEAPVDPGSLPAGHRVLIEDSVSGATFTPALPAAVGGIRTFDGVTQYVAPYATTGTYAAMAIRTDAPGGVVDVLRFTNNPADQWANGSLVLARNNFISGGVLQAIRYNPEETVSGKTASNGNWLVVEMIADGDTLTIYCDGEETMTAAAPMGATSHLVLFPQIAGGLLSFVTYDDVPADRAAIRAYMQSLSA